MRVSPLLALCASCAVLAAQKSDDRRDVVVTTNGRKLEGRVLQRFDPKEITLLQRGKRVRIPTKRVKSITTVLDDMRGFFEQRRAAQPSAEGAWGVVEWAISKELESFAALQAQHVIAEFGDHDQAHELLGHKKRRGQWAWPVGSRWMTGEAYAAHTKQWGHPLVLTGEHFSVRTDAGIRVGLDALFDLERLYVWWFDTFGTALQPREVLGDLMEVHIRASTEDFPAWSSLRIPYYVPQPNGDVAYTHVGDTPRLDRLFQLGVEQLLYNTLADGIGSPPKNPKDRFAAWLEIGLGQWAESVFAGTPGYMEPGKPTLNLEYAERFMESRPQHLKNVIGLRYSRFHDVSTSTDAHWAATSMFVAFLMDEGKNKKTRDELLEFARLVYAESKGSSSSLLDKTLGVRIEKFERPLVEWVVKTAGAKLPPKKR